MSIALQVRLTDAQHAKLKMMAERAHRSISDYVRVELLKLEKKVEKTIDRQVQSALQ